MGRSAPDGPSAAGPADEGSAAFRYPNADWRLLVRLPGRVLTAALAGQPDDPGIRVRSAVAGLEAIAAGRLFDSDLVRMVARAIYAESGAPGRAGTTETAGTAGTPGAAGIAGAAGPDRGPGGDQHAEVLSWCRAVVKVLDHDTDPGDSAAYRQWVQSIAVRTARTAGAADPADPAHPAGTAGVAAAASSLVAELGRALHLADGG